MKVLLIALNAKKQFTSLALLSLKATLLSNSGLSQKPQVQIKEFDLSCPEQTIIEAVLEFSPQVVGFSCYVWNIERVLSLISQIKTINQKLNIILGGPEVSPRAQEILKSCPGVDWIVREEGEATFLELVRWLFNPGQDIQQVSGISYRCNNKIINNPGRKEITDLDSIPFAYAGDNTALSDREACLETMRGCQFKCYFCYYGKRFTGIRTFTLPRVKQDILFLLKRKPKSIYLMDPVFNLQLNRAKEICRFIAENNPDNIPFHTEIRAELVDRELAQLLYQANIRYLEIGLQSVDNTVLRLVNRGLNQQKFIQGIQLLKQHGLTPEVHLILGLPGQTPASFKKSLEFLLNLDTALQVFRLQVLPGTAIRAKAKSLGIIYQENPPYFFLQSKTLSFAELTRLQRLVDGIGLFRGRKTIQYLCKEMGVGLVDLAGFWADWLEGNPLEPAVDQFIRYLCHTHNLDAQFYALFLKQEQRKCRNYRRFT